MEFIPTTLERYFNNAKYPIHVSMELDGTDYFFGFVLGKPEDNSSVKVYLSPMDLLNILEINNKIQEILEERDRVLPDEIDTNKNWDLKRVKMEFLKYDTWRKYIQQMLSASMNVNYFPELKYLDKHRGYWPR